MKLTPSFSLALLALALASPAESATLLSTERSVLSLTFVNAYPLYTDSDAAGIESTSPGGYLEAAVSASGLTDITNAVAEASQDSNVLTVGGGLRLEGGGAIGVSFDVADPGYPSRAEGVADSALTLIFEVASPSDYSFGVSLLAELSEVSILSGSGPAEVFVAAFVRLTGFNTGTVLELAVEDSLADRVVVAQTRSLTGVLAADTYLLEIGATGSARGFEDSIGFGIAGFGFDLLVISEPTAAALFGVGALGLLAFARPAARKSSARTAR